MRERSTVGLYIVLGLACSPLVYPKGYQHPCIPKAGLTGIVIGQDYSSILNYTSALADYSHPFGLMSYISLTTTNDRVSGLVYPTEYGSGVEWINGLTSFCANCSVQIGLWLVDSYERVPNGAYDTGLQLLTKFIGNSSSSFYIRIGYEFDSAANNYETTAYIKAFRYVADYFRHHSVTNAAFVWHAAGFQPRDNLSQISWFPGADVVDWCGVSLFQQPYHCGARTDCPTMRYAEEFASLCASMGIPLMIAESTPFGGIIDADSGNMTNEAGFVGNTWDIWFLPVLSFIQRHDVRVWSYINCDWDAFPMWRREHAPGMRWGDTRLEAHNKTLLLWRARVLQNPRFLTSYPASAEAQELQCDAPHGAGQSPTLATLTSAPVGLLMLVLAGILGLCGAWTRIWATPSHAYQMLP